MSIALGAGVCNSAIGDVLLWLNGYIVRKIHVDMMFFVVVKLFLLWGDPPTLKLWRDKLNWWVLGNFEVEISSNWPDLRRICGEFLRICEKSALKNLVVRVFASHFGNFFAVFGRIWQKRFSKIYLFYDFFCFFTLFSEK